jgi:hypothetical protein
MADPNHDEAAVTSDIFGVIRMTKLTAAHCLACGAPSAAIRRALLAGLEEWLPEIPEHLHGRFRAAFHQALDEALLEPE